MRKLRKYHFFKVKKFQGFSSSAWKVSAALEGIWENSASCRKNLQEQPIHLDSDHLSCSFGPIRRKRKRSADHAWCFCANTGPGVQQGVHKLLGAGRLSVNATEEVEGGAARLIVNGKWLAQLCSLQHTFLSIPIHKCSLKIAVCPWQRGVPLGARFTQWHSLFPRKKQSWCDFWAVFESRSAALCDRMDERWSTELERCWFCCSAVG